MATSAITILDQGTTLRWDGHPDDFVLWARSINILAPEAGVTIVDMWELREDDRVTVTTCAKDLPPWFELHPSEVCDGLATETLARLANGYSPKSVMQAPNVWRVRAGDRLAVRRTAGRLSRQLHHQDRRLPGVWGCHWRTRHIDRRPFGGIRFTLTEAGKPPGPREVPCRDQDDARTRSAADLGRGMVVRRGPRARLSRAGSHPHPHRKENTVANERVFTMNVNSEVARFFDESSRQADSAPTIVVLMGGPAAGKTTIRKKQFATGYVVVDAAEVFLNLSRGEVIPFPDGLEEPMELVGSMVAWRAITERRNIVTELIGADYEPTVEFINAMKSIGYKLSLNAITCDIDVAMQRNLSRGDDNVSCYYTEPYHRRWLIEAAKATTRM